jgi:epsin
MIYKRFTEKAAEEWRQIYKALQLLEFLIKNGSERVIDDARSHLSLLKMLRQFHFIDDNGKDQGLNVRNRSKELAELLSDVDRIRSERKKARATKNKYGGVEGGAGGGGFSSGAGAGSESRYGGFSNADAGYGQYNGGVYGDGGGFGGSSGFQDSGASTGGGGGTGSSSRRDRFEEYDEYDEGATVSAPTRKSTTTASTTSVKRTPARAEPPKKKEPEVDLFSFGDDEPVAAPAASNGKKTVTSALGDDFGTLQAGGDDDDDFDDFQSASPPAVQSRPAVAFQPLAMPTSTTSSSTTFAAPKPVSAPKAANLSDLVGFSSISPAPSGNSTPATNQSAFSPPPVGQQQQMRPAGFQQAQPNYFTSVPIGQAQGSTGTPGQVTPLSTASKPAATAKSGDAFGSLWSTASAGIKKTSTPQPGPNLASMAKQQASAGIWGSPAVSNTSTQPKPQSQQQGGQSLGNGLDDLLG